MIALFICARRLRKDGWMDGFDREDVHMCVLLSRITISPLTPLLASFPSLRKTGKPRGKKSLSLPSYTYEFTSPMHVGTDTQTHRNIQYKYCTLVS